MSHHDGRRLVLRPHQRECLLLPEIASPDVPDPVWVRVFERPFRERGQQIVDSVGDTAQHRVREGHGPLEPCPPYELDRLVHGGIARHAVEKAELVRAEPERGPHGWIELPNRPLAKGLDCVVERAHALHRSVGELPCERAITVAETFRGRPKRPVGIRLVLEHAPQHLVSDPACRRDHRSPRTNSL